MTFGTAIIQGSIITTKAQEKILLTSAEVIIITAALYRLPSISTDESEKTLQKIEVTSEIEILFCEDLKEIILIRFGLNLKIIMTSEFLQNQKVFRAILTVQENDGLYQFLMQFGDKIKIISPEKIRDTEKAVKIYREVITDFYDI